MIAIILMATIKHLVFEGGGPSGLYTYGAAKYLSIENFLLDLISAYLIKP